MASDLYLDRSEIPLLTDLYELTMAASFFEHRMDQTASFELSVRRLPNNRGYLVAAGLERLLEVLAEFRFEPEALDYLSSLGLFKAEFIQFLSELRFTGDVRALPEGSIFFANEPILEVRAPLIEAQLLETLLVNQIGLATLIASKAARCVGAADGRRLVDFGLRRSQGTDAGLVATRSSYLAGFHGTANVLAGKRYGIPLFGTMAHSFIMAHDRELEAFIDYMRSFPKTTLLVDTYSTMRGIENAVRAAHELAEQGAELQAVRIDSGELLDLSRQARRLLDTRGMTRVAIFVSGNLDENAIATLVRAKAPIDGFGVGTAMAVSADAPSLDFVYKLVEYAGKPRLKTSSGKLSRPGCKQLFRGWDKAGNMVADMVGLVEENPASIGGEFRPAMAAVTPLLTEQFSQGRAVGERRSLSAIRDAFAGEFARLPLRFKALEQPDVYQVRFSAASGAMLIEGKLRAESLQD